MVYPVTPSARQNGILAALPLSDYASMADGLEAVELACGQVIEEPGVASGAVFFPVNCTVSLVSGTQDGELSELAITGREGLVGIGSVLGMPFANHRVVVMCAGQAYRMPVADFESALSRSAALRRLALRHVQALMVQMGQGIVCSRHHSVLQRLSFWLLFNHDRSARDQLKVTHETIAHMMGVRRESITQAAGLLQAAGRIRTSRGRIVIEDAPGLRSHACECYGLVHAEYLRLQQPVQAADVVQSMQWPGALSGALQSAPDEGPVADPADRKYADIYDFAPVGLLSVDRQGRILDINMAAAILLGIQRSQSSQQRFSDCLTPEAQQAFQRFHEEVMSGRCRRHCELVLKACAHRPMRVVRIDATVDEDGTENRMVMTDITEQVQQTQALAAREREQRALLDHVPGVFWIKDPQGQFVAVNHLVQRHEQEAHDIQNIPVPSAHAVIQRGGGSSFPA